MSDVTTLLDVVELACRAPSLHNSQPWAWRVGVDCLELHTDRTRVLANADPLGRNLTISCGAALHHAQVAARGLGWEPSVARLPDPNRPDLIARIQLTPTPHTEAAVADLKRLRRRSTDRRRFTSWPVLPDRLDLLVAAAAEWHCSAVPITTLLARYRVEQLMSRAHLTQSADPALAAEHHEWLVRDARYRGDDGVPAALVPSRSEGAPSRRQRFDDGLLEEAEPRVESSDGLLVLATPSDSVLDWIAAGEALSAVWLTALYEGLSVVPFSQVVEVAATRELIGRDVLDGRSVPQLVLRIGWQAISRSELPRSPRRPVADVVLPELLGTKVPDAS